jgi:mono/diheme cytochrome c family protein
MKKFGLSVAGAVRISTMTALGVLPCALVLVASRPAEATTTYAAQTGQPCAACHTKPDGGPDLTDFGKAFQANGYKLPS